MTTLTVNENNIVIEQDLPSWHFIKTGEHCYKFSKESVYGYYLDKKNELITLYFKYGSLDKFEFSYALVPCNEEEYTNHNSQIATYFMSDPSQLEANKSVVMQNKKVTDLIQTNLDNALKELNKLNL